MVYWLPCKNLLGNVARCRCTLNYDVACALCYETIVLLYMVMFGSLIHGTHRVIMRQQICKTSYPSICCPGEADGWFIWRNVYLVPTQGQVLKVSSHQLKHRIWVIDSAGSIFRRKARGRSLGGLAALMIFCGFVVSWKLGKAIFVVLFIVYSIL